jgi:tetratricopeptide (TPR) repeat protein
MMTRWTIALILAACVSHAAQQEVPPVNNTSASPTVRGSRMLKPDGELGKAYFQTYRSIEAAERFIREHPKERDLCAGALLNIAALQERQDKKKGIATYQKAIDEYADEIVPDKNANFTVADWALFRIARLERDTGNRKKALEIFGKLMTSSDFNTRTSSRIEYLATKQSHLKVLAKVSVQGKGPFSLGTRIPVVVSLTNPSKEAVTFKCYARIEHQEHRSSHALAPREGCEEITLEPGEGRDVPMVFTETDTQGIGPGLYRLEASLTGIAFDTDSESLKIEK